MNDWHENIEPDRVYNPYPGQERLFQGTPPPGSDKAKRKVHLLELFGVIKLTDASGNVAKGGRGIPGYEIIRYRKEVRRKEMERLLRDILRDNNQSLKELRESVEGLKKNLVGLDRLPDAIRELVELLKGEREEGEDWRKR
jgi:hypothetical protein